VRIRQTLAAAVACCLLGGLLVAGCGSSGSSAASAYCDRVADIESLDLLADPAPAHVEHDLEHLLTLTRRAADVAPDAIRADARAAVHAQQRFNALYAAHGWQRDPTSSDPEFLALAGDPHLAEVYVRLERYQIRACHGGGNEEPTTVAPA
jgi:hypothetical protein